MAKAVGCKVEGVDKEFVLDVLLQNSNINEEATARIELRRKRFREDMVNRQE
ncbi:hypothetical protein LD669_11585 [Salmonella enterica]|nr:hypothetical protein [Salmonella enterica]MDJ7088710.1 hypothetical protein [Salmonella enterica]